jgi:hypothetical protein
MEKRALAHGTEIINRERGDFEWVSMQRSVTRSLQGSLS